MKSSETAQKKDNGNSVLAYYGYNDDIANVRYQNNPDCLDIGRIIAEHKERYTVMTDSGECEAEITGTMRFTAKNREDYPAVGDWVSLSLHGDNFAVIHHILPRSSVIKRQAAGQHGAVQIIAANIDYAIIVQAADRDFNINRLERYLTICHSANVKPVIVLSKTDLLPEADIDELIRLIQLRISDVPVFAVSNETRNGYESIIAFIEKGKTYCLLGSSGVGKSTLMNNLSGKHVMKTDAVSKSNNKGRHVTSHRELIVLDSGGILIDNPGMREVGIADESCGLEITFDAIHRLSENCKFKDCTHTNETGCAVLDAIENGSIEKSSYDNFMKMEKEKAHFESSIAERRKKDKAFGKMIKHYKKDRDRHNHQ